MIMREWRGRLPHDRVDDYFRYLKVTGLPEYGATPGHRGTWVLLDREGETAEYTLLTLWESRNAIRAFAGDDISRAKYYPDDRQYFVDMPAKVRHYEVLARSPQESAAPGAPEALMPP
jgi:heme-degrading monooxygenase HmoA